MENTKILLLTLDKNLANQLSSGGGSRSLEISTFPNLKALGRMSELGNYKAILVDESLEDLTGNEVAEYIDVFFKHIPVIIMTSDPELPFKSVPWAASVKAVYDKKSGASDLLKRVLEVVSINVG